MYSKLILEVINPEGDIEHTLEFHSYRDIGLYLTDVSYTDIRAIHLQSDPLTKKKFLHPNLKALTKKYLIYTNPNIYTKSL